MNKKGFTLVELLAVIVILAIIALIVTPVVNNIITSARTSANARSVEGHIRNVELAIITEAFTKETGDLTVYDMTDGSIPSSIIDRIPNNDSIFCMKYTIENGTVLSASDCVSNINNWNKAYSYTNTTGAKVTGLNGGVKATFEAPVSSDTHKGIIYMDPTDLTVECTSTSTIDATSTTGCKKFYIYNDEGNTYKLIMDRNIAIGVRYVSEADFIAAGGTEEEYGDYGNNTKGPITANSTLKNKTTGWIGNPRMITADEIAHIVGADREDTIKWNSSKGYGVDIEIGAYTFYLDGGYNSNPTTYSVVNGWQKKVATTHGSSHYAWLYDYLYNCTGGNTEHGCSIASTDGGERAYWTSTPHSTSTSEVWIITLEGSMTLYHASTNVYSIRPVIELPKTLFNS